MKLLRAGLAVVAVVALASGCSEVQGAVDDALSSALRTVASTTLTQAAERNGVPLKADPECTGGVQSGSASAEVNCQAETQTGLPVSGSLKIENAGDVKACRGEMTIRIGDQPPFTQKISGCSG